MSSVPPVVIAASAARQTATLLFLHGLGDTGHGWATTLAQYKLPHMKLVCPTAEKIPVTLNGGYRMPSWFDLKSLDRDGAEDRASIETAVKLVHRLIDDEIRDSGLNADRVVLGGFSMGGALALYAALKYPRKLAGVVAVSCWLPLHEDFAANDHGSIMRDLPILQLHGDCDPIVQYRWGQSTAAILKQFTNSLDFRTYKGVDHSASDQELSDIREFFRKIIPSTD